MLRAKTIFSVTTVLGLGAALIFVKTDHAGFDPENTSAAVSPGTGNLLGSAEPQAHTAVAAIAHLPKLASPQAAISSAERTSAETETTIAPGASTPRPEKSTEVEPATSDVSTAASVSTAQPKPLPTENEHDTTAKLNKRSITATIADQMPTSLPTQNTTSSATHTAMPLPQRAPHHFRAQRFKRAIRNARVRGTRTLSGSRAALLNDDATSKSRLGNARLRKQRALLRQRRIQRTRKRRVAAARNTQPAQKQTDVAAKAEAIEDAAKPKKPTKHRKPFDNNRN